MNRLFDILKYKVYMNYSDGHLMIYFMFYPILITLMGFTVINPIKLLDHIGYSLIYINMFLSFVYSLENLLHKEHERGKLDLFYLIHTPLEIICLFKLISHWFIYGLSLVCFMSMMHYIFNFIDINNSFYVMLYGTLYLNALGLLVSAFVLGLKQNIFLLYMLLYPIYIPFVILSHHPILLEIIGPICFCLFLITPMFTSYVLKKSYE